MMVGLPSLLTSARLLPATSPLTFANFFACSRQTLAGAASNPDGPGVSRSFLRKLRDSAEIMLCGFQVGPPGVGEWRAARFTMYSNRNKKHGRSIPSFLRIVYGRERVLQPTAWSSTCTEPERYETTFYSAARIVLRYAPARLAGSGAGCVDFRANHRRTLRSHFHTRQRRAAAGWIGHDVHRRRHRPSGSLASEMDPRRVRDFEFFARRLELCRRAGGVIVEMGQARCRYLARAAARRR